MDSQVTVHQTENNWLTEGLTSKDEKSRLGQFQTWMDASHVAWWKPDLAGYRDYLLERGLSTSSVKAHLSTIRARYESLLRDPTARQALFSLAYEQLTHDRQAQTPANAAAYVNELVRQIEAALHPQTAPVKTITRQDITDSEHVRLTADQASHLLNRPGVHFLKGLRDTSILALMLCTGIREQELCDLRVEDLRQRLGGALALHVRKGKGAKERLIPYGNLEWCLVIVEKWLDQAGITSGIVFRGIRRGGKTVRSTGLTTRAVQLILAAYPITIDGRLTQVRPHDLRRTYARRLYEAGVDLVAIQQNLGHADLKTTQRYIGTLDADQRKPPAVYQFDLTQLK